MNPKNCLLVFRNKKINRYDNPMEIINRFASSGIYFERFLFCDYGASAEIARSIDDACSNYGNIVIVCPKVMEEAIKNRVQKLLNSAFDYSNVIATAEVSAFIYFDDFPNKLNVDEISQIICKQRGEEFGRCFLKTVGAPYDLIKQALDEADSICGGCTYNVSEHYSECSIEIVYPINVAKSLFDSAHRAILIRLNDYIYAIENVSLAERLYQLLQLRRMKISFAESFTGGGLAKRLVEIPGVSEVYFEGINSYSNESKIKRLGVPPLILNEYGAVSEQTALAMAKGLIDGGDCDIAVSTTGIAGPKSDNTYKPVGLAYIGVATSESAAAYKYELKGSRKNITETAINLALFHAYKILK